MFPITIGIQWRCNTNKIIISREGNNTAGFTENVFYNNQQIQNYIVMEEYDLIVIIARAIHRVI